MDIRKVRSLRGCGTEVSRYATVHLPVSSGRSVLLRRGCTGTSPSRKLCKRAARTAERTSLCKHPGAP